METVLILEAKRKIDCIQYVLGIASQIIQIADCKRPTSSIEHDISSLISSASIWSNSMVSKKSSSVVLFSSEEDKIERISLSVSQTEQTP